MTNDPVDVSVVRLADDVRSVAGARDWMRAFLERSEAEPECVEHAILIVSELASNAVRHGSGDVVCQLTSTGSDRCLLTVIDFGRGTPAVVDRAVGDIGGLGLVIVDRLALAWGVAAFDGGKAVYALLSTSLRDAVRGAGPVDARR